MKILIIGSKGQLGWELCRRATPKGWEIVSADLPEFDVTDRKVVEEAVYGNGYVLVINASAYTAVDRAETEVEQAYSVNRDAPRFLAESCFKAEVPLIHVSTDYVFDGSHKTPYHETTPTSPIGIYGKSKATGEQAVRSSLREHVILRTSWVYGVHGNNFVKTMIRIGREQKTVRVVADQFGCPTFAGDLAEAVLDIASQIVSGNAVQWGTYHYCGQGIISWHGFACKIFEIANRFKILEMPTVLPIPTADYPTPAERPQYSALDCSQIEEHFGIKPIPWEKSLEKMIKECRQKQFI